MTVSKKKVALIAGGVGLAVLIAGGGVVIAKGSQYGWGHHRGGMAGAHMEQMIEQIDTNGDGALSGGEISAYRDARFLAMDSNADGELTPLELTEGVRAMHFAAMDSNGDGMVSQAEFNDAGMGRHSRVERGFHKLDDDDNGRISLEEMTAMTERMMSWVDDNDDGSIGADELQEMRDRHHR